MHRDPSCWKWTTDKQDIILFSVKRCNELLEKDYTGLCFYHVRPLYSADMYELQKHINEKHGVV